MIRLPERRTPPATLFAGTDPAHRPTAARPWMLKAALAHDKRTGRRRRGFSGRAVLAAGRSPGAVFGSGMELQVAEAHRRDAEADRELEMMRQLRSCPKCGSERYTFRRAKR
jgi:hypothetical protein